MTGINIDDHIHLLIADVPDIKAKWNGFIDDMVSKVDFSSLSFGASLGGMSSAMDGINAQITSLNTMLAKGTDLKASIQTGMTTNNIVCDQLDAFLGMIDGFLGLITATLLPALALKLISFSGFHADLSAKIDPVQPLKDLANSAKLT